jgi:hypothetical protein
MTAIVNLMSDSGHRTTLYRIPGATYGGYLSSYDTLLLSSEGKETDVGIFREGVAEELGFAPETVTDWANRLHYEFETVSLACLKTKRPESHLKGIILVPGEQSVAFRRLVLPDPRQPYRDYYYNLAYESIHFASHEWRARNIALTHWSSNIDMHSNIVACIAEALGHCVDSIPRQGQGISKFAFVGPRILGNIFYEIDQLPGSANERHNPIQLQVKQEEDIAIIELQCFKYRAN